MFNKCSFICKMYLYEPYFTKQTLKKSQEQTNFRPSTNHAQKLDAIDLQIIRELEEDSRISLRKLAQKLGLTLIFCITESTI
jgi:hypothetical protein